jgi:hypothetical protein
VFHRRNAGLFVFGENERINNVRMKEFFMAREDISPEGNKLACVVSSNAESLDQWERKQKQRKRQKQKRPSRMVRERLEEARKYAPLADCNDGL